MRNKTLYFFISIVVVGLTIFVHKTSYAQEKKSIEDLYHLSNYPDTVALDMINDSVWLYLDRNIIFCSELLEFYSEYINKIENSGRRINFYITKSAYYNYLDQNDSALHYLELSIKTLNSVENTEEKNILRENNLPYIYNNLALIYDDMGMYESATEFQYKCQYEVKYILKKDSTNRSIRRLNSNINTELGIFYSNFNDTINANKHFIKGIDLAIEYKDTVARTYAEANYAVYLTDINEYDKALKYLYKTRKYYSDENNIYNQILIDLNISNIYSQQNKLNLAIEIADSCKNISNNCGFISLEQSSIKMLFYIYNDSNKNLALKYGEDFNDLAIINDEQNELSEVLFEMSIIYKNKRDYKKAYSLLFQSKQIDDSIVNLDHKANVLSLETKYKLMEASNENKLLMNENTIKDEFILKQKRNNKIIIVLLILTSIFGYILFAGRKKLKDVNSKLEGSNKLLELKTEELNKYNRSLERSFSTISHDLKGSIGTANSFFKILNSNDSKISDKDRNHYIKIIGNSMNITYSMLEGLLYWSRYKLNNSVNISEFSIYPLIYEIIDNVEQTIITKGITFNIYIDERVTIKSDIMYLRIIIRNILNNAVKYTHENGLIIVSLINVDSKHKICIRDNGVGMSEIKVKNLFKDNHSVKGTNNETGTGLGLMISKDLTESIGGTIHVVSNLNKGTTFIIELPT